MDRLVREVIIKIFCAYAALHAAERRLDDATCNNSHRLFLDTDVSIIARKPDHPPLRSSELPSRRKLSLYICVERLWSILPPRLIDD